MHVYSQKLCNFIPSFFLSCKNECDTVIAATRGAIGADFDTVLQRLNDASDVFGDNMKKKFTSTGEW